MQKSYGWIKTPIIIQGSCGVTYNSLLNFLELFIEQIKEEYIKFNASISQNLEN